MTKDVPEEAANLLTDFGLSLGKKQAELRTTSPDPQSLMGDREWKVQPLGWPTVTLWSSLFLTGFLVPLSTYLFPSRRLLSLRWSLPLSALSVSLSVPFVSLSHCLFSSFTVLISYFTILNHMDTEKHSQIQEQIQK